MRFTRGTSPLPASTRPIVGSALVLATVLIAAWALYDARRTDLREAEQQENNIAAALERSIERTVTTLDLSLRAAITGVAIPGLSTMDPATKQAVLFDGALTADSLGGLFTTDDRGIVTNVSRGDAALGDSREDRDYFRIHRDDPFRGLLLTGPVHGRADDEWTLILSRRISHADGSFAGVAVAGLHLSFFNGLFQSLDLAPDAVVALLSSDRRLIARRPVLDQQIGRDMHSAAVFDQLATHPNGRLRATAMYDGIERVYSYRQIGDLPLVISVGFSTRSIFAAWVLDTAIICLVLCLLSGLHLLLSRALGRELAERRRAEAAATAARTEAVLLTQELSLSLTRLETLINNSADAMIVAQADRHGVFVYETVNPVWERLTGVAAAAAVGKPPGACLPAKLASAVTAGWQEAVQRRGPASFSFRSQHGGTEQCWDALVCPVMGPDGSIHRLIATERNVTEQRLLEARLRDVERMEAVGGLTAGLAHDFNNLLQIMLGALEVAGDSAELESDRRTAMTLAAEAGSRAASLIHQLLAFSRKQVLNPTPLDPERVIADTMVASRPLLGPGYRLTSEVSAGIGQVFADARQLHQCLTHIILNGREAMPQGGPLRLVVQHAGAEEALGAGLDSGDYIRFTVEDEGDGMSDATIARAFEPFFTTKGIGQGAGLGLSMVHGFARQSGGDVTIESAIGVGTAVTLWLPRREDLSTPATPSRVTPPAPAGVKHCRILVVDDEAPVRQTLALFLRKAGYQSVLAENGMAALALIESGQHFDLLVTDQSMPSMSGLELIRSVARCDPSLRTLLVTGFDRVAGLEGLAGTVTVLTKPFRRTVFLDQVASLLAAEIPMIAAA